jgi:hypothetical protein
MKKKTKKLVLAKETVRSLEEARLGQARGGGPDPITYCRNNAQEQAAVART